jgi:hypothetical protein
MNEKQLVFHSSFIVHRSSFIIMNSWHEEMGYCVGAGLLVFRFIKREIGCGVHFKAEPLTKLLKRIAA